MSRISTSQPTSQECARLDQIEASYQNWVRAYSEQREKSPCVLKLYHVSQNDPVTFSFLPAMPFGPAPARHGLLRAIWSGISSFSLFPYTNVIPQSVELASDEEAILSDWTVTGLDLFHSIRGCRIPAPHGPAEP